MQYRYATFLPDLTITNKGVQHNGKMTHNRPGSLEIKCLLICKLTGLQYHKTMQHYNSRMTGQAGIKVISGQRQREVT